MSIIKNAIEKWKYRKEHPCCKCEFVDAIGNHSPCFGCHNRDKWTPMPEPPKED